MRWSWAESRQLRAKTARSLVVSSLFVVTGIVAGITAGVVHQTAGAVAADLAARRLAIGLAFLVELRRGVDGLIAVGIVRHAADPVAAIIPLVVPVIAGRMVSVVLAAISHAGDQGSDYGAGDDISDIMSAMVIHPRIRV